MPVNKRYFIDLMKDRRLSLREVARRMDVWPAALSRSIDGKRKMQMPEAVALARRALPQAAGPAARHRLAGRGRRRC